MQTETKSIDKSGWGPGPWQDEPDRVEFEHLGFPCLMVRQKSHGGWCGYVAVPPGHPWHGAGYDLDVEIHGGITYGEKCAGEICHVPKPGEPDDVWWLGFDCAHAWDFSPARDRTWPRFGDEVYRTAAYVRGQCARLAEQAKTATP